VIVEEPKEEIVTFTEPEIKPVVKKPKGATINIYNLNPNDPQSITARSPAIKQKN